MLYRVHTKRGEKRWHGKVGEQCVKIVCTVNDARESVVWRKKGNGKGKANGLRRNTVTGREIIIKYQHTSALLQRAAQWVIEKVRKFAKKGEGIKSKNSIVYWKIGSIFCECPWMSQWKAKFIHEIIEESVLPSKRRKQKKEVFPKRRKERKKQTAAKQKRAYFWTIFGLFENLVWRRSTKSEEGIPKKEIKKVKLCLCANWRIGVR